MSGILRSWLCQNELCATEFDSWEPYPCCPRCKNVRTQWLPRGGHIAAKSPSLDGELRALADAFKMTDLASAREGERVKPALPAPPSPSGPQMQFAPGFAAAPFARDRDGRVRAVCQPSSQGVDFKVKHGINAPLTQAPRARLSKA